MAAVDWTDRELIHGLEVQMLDPVSRDAIGTLDPSYQGSTVTEGLSDSTYSSATLTFPDWSLWIENSWLRIVHTVPARDFSETLFTGFVYDEGAELYHGILRATPNLRSSIAAFEKHSLEGPFYAGEGSSAKQALESVLDHIGQPWRIAAGFTDYRFSDTRCWDPGTYWLSLAEDLLELCGGTVMADPDGTVVCKRDVDPASMSPSFSLNSDDEHTLVLDCKIKRSGNSRTVPGRTIVWFRDGEEQVSGYAEVSSSNQASPSRRGYTVDDVVQLDDMDEPRTSARAAAIAKERVEKLSAVVRAWDVKTMWFQVHAGDVGEFAPPGMESRKVRVADARKDLRSWTMDLTLEEV